MATFAAAAAAHGAGWLDVAIAGYAVFGRRTRQEVLADPDNVSAGT